jgi:hypothetical protein
MVFGLGGGGGGGSSNAMPAGLSPQLLAAEAEVGKILRGNYDQKRS